jgi:hypothetical protein
MALNSKGKMPGTPEAQRRVEERVTKVLPVDCRILELPKGQLSGQGQKCGFKFPARTINVSKGGILINSDYEIGVNTMIELKITGKIKGTTKAVTLIAEVARTRRNAYDIFGRWAMGLKIQEIDPKDMSLMSEHFETLD